MFLLLSVCTKYDEMRAFHSNFMTLCVVYKWLVSFGYVDRESRDKTRARETRKK